MKVSVYERSNALWIRFQYNGEQRRVSTGLSASRQGHKAASAIAKQIEADLIFQRLTDERLREYLGKPVETVTQSKTLAELWHEFVEFKRKSLATTTFLNNFSTTRNAMRSILTSVEPESLIQTVAILNRQYSAGTSQRIAADIIAFGNWLVDIGERDKNPWTKLKKLLDKTASTGKSREAFTDGEALAIIHALKTDEFLSQYSAYTHSHYLRFVRFLFATGCRPGEAVALTSDCLTMRGNDLFVTIKKAYSKGVLKQTKTGTERTFKCNSGLYNLLCDDWKRCSQFGVPELIFMSHRGKYIDLHNFTKKVWQPIVKGLVEQGKIKKYLPLYNCRHTAITRMLRAGLDAATIANICGNSPEIIFKHYAKGDEDVDLPEIVT